MEVGLRSVWKLTRQVSVSERDLQTGLSRADARQVPEVWKSVGRWGCGGRCERECLLPHSCFLPLPSYGADQRIFESQLKVNLALEVALGDTMSISA